MTATFDYTSAGFRERHMEQTFHNYYAVTDKQKDVVIALQDHAECFSSKWVILLGPPGTGKDHLLSALTKAWVEKNLSTHPKVYADTLQGILRKYREMAYNTEGVTEIDAMNWFAGLDILVLRDVGVKEMTSNELATIVDIIDHRYNDRRLIFMSGNVAPEGIKEVFDERVASRISEMGLLFMEKPYIKCDWKDYRRERREETI